MRMFRATVDDVPRIEWCARMCCAEHEQWRMNGGLNWQYYRECWEKIMRSGLGVMFLYEDSDGMIVAGLGGARHREMLTGKWRASQVFIYSQPEVRGRVSIRKLVRSFEDWAREQGCFDVTQPLLDSMPSGTERFFRAGGYRPLQTLFVKTIGEPL